MTLLMALLLVPLMLVCSVGPGFFFIRRLRLTADEALCLAIALSLVLIYLAATGIYLLGIHWHWCWALTFLFLGMTALSWRDWRWMLRKRRVRLRLLWFAALLGMGILLLGLIRNHSGGQWSMDWREHYQRAQFFLQRLPYDAKFGEIYTLPARPPMMNLLCAYFMAQVGQEYAIFQICSLLLSTLVFFPVVLLAGMLVRQGARQIFWIAAFLAASPVLFQNITWPWTKLLTCFYILLATALYWRGWRKNSPARTIAAAGCMAAAILVHYSAGPYAVFLVVHYLATTAWRRHRGVEIAGSAALASLLLLSWFGWALAVYGLGGTFGSNTTVTGSSSRGAVENLSKIAFNFFTTLVPHPLRMRPLTFRDTFEQPNQFGLIRDYFFVLFQQNLIFSMGMVGGIVAIWLAIRSVRRLQRPLQLFWIGYVLFATVIGIAVVPTKDPFGVAHICLQPLTLLGLALVGASFTRLSRGIRIALVCGMVVDVALGIILQVRMESLLPRSMFVGKTEIIPLSPGLLTAESLNNALSRLRLSIPCFSNACTTAGPFIWPIVIGGFSALIYRMAGYGNGRAVRLALTAMMLLAGSACICDRWMGYQTRQNTASRPEPTEALAAQVLAPLLQTVQHDNESPDAHFQLAMGFNELGRIDLAANELYLALLLDPHHPDARYWVHLYASFHHIELPETLLTDLYRRQHLRDVNRSLTYGVELYKRGFASHAQQVFSDIVRQSPQTPAAHLYLGIVLFERGQTREGIAEGETALRLSPQLPAAEETLRRMLTVTGQSQPAIDAEIRRARGY